MKKDIFNGTPTETITIDDSAASAPPPLELDPTKYAPLVADLDMDEVQTRAMLEAIWSIMKGLVDLGTDLRTADFCGSIFGSFNERAEGSADRVQSCHPTITETDTTTGKADHA